MSFECVSFEFEEGIAFIYSGIQGSEVRAIEFGERKGSADARCPMPDARCPGTPNLPEKGYSIY
ncbi:hypothetical protein [Microcoleus sp. herbarium5]|uniref:hypothetical protein n=1 Tax=Microcoleus sp. herbarium5 TaxID=3055434 RepID=UPI002FD29509